MELCVAPARTAAQYFVGKGVLYCSGHVGCPGLLSCLYTCLLHTLIQPPVLVLRRVLKAPGRLLPSADCPGRWEGLSSWLDRVSTCLSSLIGEGDMSSSILIS